MVKDQIKKLHRIIPWVRLVDVVAERTTFMIAGVGTVQIGSFLVSVDTRPTTVDRSRLFQHTKTKLHERRPAEWTFGCRSILFTPEGKESMEILDHSVLNVHGFLYKDIDGLRDASIALKLGRLHIPYDDIVNSSALARRSLRNSAKSFRPPADTLSTIDENAVEHEDEHEDEPEPEEVLMRKLSAAKDFITSILRGIREVSFAISFMGLSKKVDFVQPNGKPLWINMAMKELGLDLYRLDPTSAAHAMYFEKADVAHQALLSAISVSLGIDDGHEKPERLIYIPMTTTTIRTTLPAKLLQYSAQKEALNRNANILFANLVITSPSVDLDPHHLPLIIAMAKQRPHTASSRQRGHHLLTRFLPRTNLKLSIHEPVVRVTLPPVSDTSPDQFEFDLLVSAVSSISLDVDSSHSMESGQYLLSSSLRVASHRLYYQTTSRETYDLLNMDGMELRVRLTAAAEVSVSAYLNFQTLSMSMVRQEISAGVRQIVHQLRSNVSSDKLRHAKTSQDPNALRALPSWFHHFEIEASDFSVEIAGLDPRVSPTARGFALHLEGLTAEYNAHPDLAGKKHHMRKRAISHSSALTTPQIILTPPPDRKKPGVSTDGRRVATHLKGFEAFIIETTNRWESTPFIRLPRAEVAITTSNDGHGSTLHVNSHFKAIYVQYSLFRHYAMLVALVTMRKTFSHSRRGKSGPHAADREQFPSPTVNDTATPERFNEYITLDVRAPFIQVKASMPHDPDLMIHIYELEAGRHRWKIPFAKLRVARLFARSPSIKHAWARVVSIKNGRIDLRETKRRKGSVSVTEKSIDFVSDAIRIGIPHQLVVHKIFDNFVNTLKANIQLHHRFKTESEEYVLAKHPEGPKHVPKMSIRTHVFLFELEDGAFDWKLATIYRAGVLEQKQRIAREEAYRIKVQHLKKDTPAPPSTRSQSVVNGESLLSSSPKPDGDNTSQMHSSFETDRRRMRYDKEGRCQFSRQTRTSIDDAWDKLQRHNAQSWKTRIDRAFQHQTGAVKDLRHLMWGLDGLTEDVHHEENILQIPQRPALMSVWMSDLHMAVDKTSFPAEQLPDFMHRVGKGLPRDTQFGLLVPMHLKFEMGEVRMSLRDYPLPLLHIPALKHGQSPRLPSWSLETDFVIAEEFRDFASTRDLQIEIVPPDKLDPDRKSGGFYIDVRRTVSPVKTYSEIVVEINTARETRFTWGNSYQPAIQDMMQVIEGFTKPQLDPSPRVGFWDKIRLSFHSHVSVVWKNGGDVHLMLKGSRDPYQVTGHGAGFVMVWRTDVKWNIWREEDPKKFMTVDSGDYILAIPDFSSYARQLSHQVSHQASEATSMSSSGDDGLKFKKVIMKLSGKVQWIVGLVLERNLDDGTRSFEFGPHYDVTLRNPDHVKGLREQKSYDAFAGFRSHHIHMSIAILAPSDRDWSVMNKKPADNYNSVHLTPRFFTHFYAWWHLFSGAMSLPIRQGKLFPGIEKSGKKFGRHLATLKYSLLLSPLMVAHVYKHKEAEEFEEDTLSATGLKMRLNSFMLDLHQRREEFKSEVKSLHKVVKTSHMKIYQTFLDLISADIRAVSADITGTSADSVRKATDEKLAGFQEAPRSIDLAKFLIPDNDYTWIDVDDLVEIDWTLPTDHDPSTKILPLAYAPRFTYRKQTDHHNTIAGDVNRHSPFGYEDTHHCVMSEQNDSRKVQIDIIERRLKRIEELLEHQAKAVNEQEVHAVREIAEEMREQTKLEELREHTRVLQSKKHFLQAMVRDLQKRLKEHDLRAVPDPEELDLEDPKSQARQGEVAEDAESGNRLSHQTTADGLDATKLNDHVSEFNNRFVIHDPQIKWNNPLRNIMLRYIHQVSQRRGFVYYTSRQAVKFLLDLVEEQSKTKTSSSVDTPQDTASSSEQQTPFIVDGENSDDDEMDVNERINQLLNDGKRFVNADDPEDADANRAVNMTDEANRDVSHDFVAQNTYHVRLVAPQIQLQSEKNIKSAILLTARGMRLKVYSIMDKDRISDEVSGLVQRRFAIEMDNMQFFVTNKQLVSAEALHMYSGNPYGTPSGTVWPPWMPLEAMFDFSSNPYGFQRVVERTSATLRYDKFNKLRLKYDENVDKETATAAPSAKREKERTRSGMDRLWLDFPSVRAICDSNQYYAMYIIVVDLLLWSEPLEKTRNERLEKIMMVADFNDLRGAPELVVMLQERIRQLNEIKTHFHVNEKYLDRQGWQDRISVEQDLASCEDELFFMMKAITTSQRKIDDGDGNGMLRYNLSANQIVWHLTKEGDVPLAEFQLANAAFERTDNADGSNHNEASIDRIHGLNLLPNAVYPNIISAYTEHLPHGSSGGDYKMLHVHWQQLEAIAGIPVVETFEVNLFPLRVQLEKNTGKQLFRYIFPQMAGDGGEGGGGGDDGSINGFSPFMVRNKLPQHDEEDEEDEETEMEAKQESILAATRGRQPGSAMGAGSLEHRLMPTLALPDGSEKRPPSAGSTRSKASASGKFAHGLGINIGQDQLSNLARSAQTRVQSGVQSAGSSFKLMRQNSSDSFSLLSRGRRDSKATINTVNTIGQEKKPSRFHLSRTARSSSRDSKSTKGKRSDDLTQMMTRASNYMTLAYVKIPAVVLCLSYKGQGKRNFEDVHSLVFKMPTLEYRNKTWSNLDLALALKKDVIRTLIAHTGAIISNKLTHHKPDKSQQSRLRELASSAAIMSSSEVSRITSSTVSIHRGINGGAGGTFGSGELHDSPRSTDESFTFHKTESYESSLSFLPEDDLDGEPLDGETQKALERGEEEGSSKDLLRRKLTRHLSELTAKATIRRNSTNGDDAGALAEAPETTPSKGHSHGGKFKKLLHALDRDKEKE